jgi:hypothetical protein
MAAVTLPPGADPALAIARPNVERLVWETVKPLGGAVTWAYSATEGDPPSWLFTCHVQVDIRASTRSGASARADEARRALCALPWADWPGGVIARVDVTDGPFWLPDESGAPRYVARYSLTAHPRPAAA